MKQNRYSFVAIVGILAVAAALTFLTGSSAEAGMTLSLANAAVAAAAVTPQDLDGLKASIQNVSEQVKNFAEDVAGKMKAGETITAELKEKSDKALSELGEMRSIVQELEQKAARPAQPQNTEAQTPGSIFINDEKVKKFMAEKASRGRVRIDMAAITSGNQSAGATIAPPMRVPGFVAIPDRRMTVRDLLTPGRTSQNAIQFVVEEGFTNRAAHVSEGGLKPQSDIRFELVTKSVATIAHWMLASKQVLDDSPMLQSHIDGRLRYGLAYVEEDQLLNGDGTGTNIHGIIPQAADYSAPISNVQAETMIDTVRLALLQSELAEFPATGIILHPTDWTRIELTKDGENRYIFAQPQSLASPRLWNRPVVATQAMEEDEFLVGAFQLGAQVFDREDANVEVSTEDSDNFRKNLITIRAEERLVLAVYRPEAFVTGDFGNIT